MGRAIFATVMLVRILDVGDRILVLVTSFDCFVSNIRHHYRCSHFWLLTLWCPSPSILRGLSKWYSCAIGAIFSLEFMNFYKVYQKSQVLVTNVGHFDTVISINSHPICIKICREDKCNLNRPEGQCKSRQYYQNMNQLPKDSELHGQRNQKNDQNGQYQRNKRDIFLEYSSHDPITELIGQVSKIPSSFSAFDLSLLSYPT